MDHLSYHLPLSLLFIFSVRRKTKTAVKSLTSPEAMKLESFKRPSNGFDNATYGSALGI